MDRDPADVVSHKFDLSGVQSSADFDPELRDSVANIASATDCASRSVESRNEGIANGIDLASVETRQLLSYQSVMLFEKLQPAAITPIHDRLGRADNVGEEHRGEHAVGLTGRLDSGQQFLDFVDNRVPSLRPPGMIHARHFDKARTRDVFGEKAAFGELHITIPGAVHDERRHPNTRQHFTDIDRRVHFQERKRSTGACAATMISHQLSQSLRVEARCNVVKSRCPVALDRLVGRLALLRSRRPRIIRAPDPLGEATKSAKRDGPFRVSSCEKNAHVASLGCAEERGALRADRVHDRANIVHPLIQSGQAIVRHVVRHSGPAFIEEDETGEGCEALKTEHEVRQFPGKFDVREPARHVNDIKRPLTHDLIGDVDIAAPDDIASWVASYRRSCTEHYSERKMSCGTARGKLVGDGRKSDETRRAAASPR